MREHLYWRSLAVGLVMLCCLPSAAEAFFNLRGWAEQQTESGATPVTDFSLLQVDRGAVTVADARTEMLVKQYEEKEQFSECWRGVVGGLKQSCQAVVADQHERSRLALGFTNCQLTTDGKTEFSVNCPPSYDVSKCVARLDASIYPVYLQFSLHVDTLCFHVQQEMARRKADATVARLQRATNDLKVQVGDLGAKAEDAIHVIDGLRTDARRAADDVNSGLTTLLHAQERLGHDIEAKQASMANLATAIESAHEKQTQVAAALQKGMGEVEAVARRQSESINRIGLAAQTIKQGIEEAKSSAARLMADQAALGTHVQDVGQSVKALQSAQDISTEKAERLTEQLSTVMATLDTALKNQLDAMDLIHQRTLLIATEADAQQRYLVQMHESLNYVQSVAVSVESILFYLALSIGIVLLTTARPLAESRFAALMWGPVACAVVEKWFLHEGTLFLTIVKLGAAKPSMVFDWGLFMEFVTPAAQSCPVRQLHWSFAAVVAVVLAKAWWSYESPETKQRRAVEAAVSRAFVDAFSEGGLAAKYLVRSYGLERVTTRAKTPPPPSRPTDVIESLS